MKKMICAALALCLSLCACGAEPAVPTEATTVPEAVTEAPAETVTEAVTQAAAPETVEITLENWEEYFELRPAADVWVDGENQSWSLGYGLFLREEFLPRFREGNVNFELEYDLEQREFTGDAETLTWTLGELLEPDRELLPGAKTFGLEDFRSAGDLPGFAGSVAGVCLSGTVMTRPDGSLMAEVPANGRILHAEGSLILE